jgi:hypothetical protein
MTQDGLKLSQMAQDSLNWPKMIRMVQNGQKWSETI